MVAPLLLALKIQLALITTLRINCKTEDPLKSLYPNLSKCVHIVNPHLLLLLFLLNIKRWNYFMHASN